MKKLKSKKIKNKMYPFLEYKITQEITSEYTYRITF